MKRKSLVLALAVLLIVPSGATAATATATATTGEPTPTASGTTGAQAKITTTDVAQQSSDEYLEAFREFEGNTALESYSEFEAIRTQAVVTVQAGSFDATERTQMQLVLTALQQFSTSHRLAEEGNLEQSLVAANETRTTLVELEAEGGERYSTLAGVALDRFYRSLGERLETQSRANVSTPEQITLLEQSAMAYRLGGSANRFADLSVRTESLQAQYRSDVEDINQSVAAAQTFMGTCEEECTAPVSAVVTHQLDVFEQYQSARSAQRESTRAVTLAEQHGLSDRRGALTGMSEAVTTRLLSLALACVLVAAAYAVVIGAPLMLVTTRLSTWANDHDAAAVGSVLTNMPPKGGYDATE